MKVEKQFYEILQEYLNIEEERQLAQNLVSYLDQ